MTERESQAGRVEDSEPILVSGVYRSGTTFLASLLGAHPDVRASSSTIKFIRFCLHRYGEMDDPANRRRLVEDTARRVYTRWEINLDSEAVLTAASRHSRPSYALLYDLLMREVLCKSEPDSVRWLEKLAVQWSGISDFLDMFPNGRVVHVIRDPRDVTASYKSMTFEPGNTYLDAAFNCRGSMEAMHDLEPRYRERVLVVRAEDLAQRPDKMVWALQQFLGLAPDSSMLDPDNLHAVGEDWATNTSFGGRYTKWPDASPRWMEHLSRIEVLFTELITQPWLVRNGYTASGFVPSAQEWNDLYALVDDDFLRGRFEHWLTTGRGIEGYRSDPYKHEMKIVFPERFPAE